MESLKDLVKPPFANYDVVVYFGGGLFAIPFLAHYLLVPLQIGWPKFSVDTGSVITNEVVSGLTLLFSIYILGHFLAYIGSQLVEKAIDRFLGKISTAILISSMATSANRNSAIRAVIYNKIKSISRDKAIFPSVVRVIFHLPVIIIYMLVFTLGIFGYYNTRVTPEVIAAARRDISKLNLDGLTLKLQSPWFKPLEYYVINRDGLATARMYNYLVIGGLFRSLCVIFMGALWLHIYYIIHYFCDGDWRLPGSSGAWSAFFQYAFLSALYIFSLFSYLKFQRRYCEEAIFAFVFEKPASSTHP